MERAPCRPRQGSEREMLQGHPEYLRPALMAKLDGLELEQAGWRLVPSQTAFRTPTSRPSDRSAQPHSAPSQDLVDGLLDVEGGVVDDDPAHGVER